MVDCGGCQAREWGLKVMNKILGSIYRLADVCAENGVKANRVRMSPFTHAQLKAECTYEEVMQLERDGLIVEVVHDCPPDTIYVDRL